MSRKQQMIDALYQGLIVSCQAVPSEPHYTEDMTVTMAKCAKWGGAVAIRTDTPRDVKAIKEATGLPVIGIWKIGRGVKDVYLTPTLEAARALYDAGAEIIACQATSHIREDGKQAYEIIREIRDGIPEALIFADVATLEDGVIAAEYGADFVAPTLSGAFSGGKFVPGARVNDGPDLKLLRQLVRAVEGKSRVIMEGRVATPEQAVQCLYLGAHAVVVGNAITRPHVTAKRFATAIKRYEE